MSAPTVKPHVHEPRERSAVLVATTAVTAVSLWVAYLIAVAESWGLSLVLLGTAIVASAGAIVGGCWYRQQKASAHDHAAILESIDQIREQQQRLLEALTKRKSAPYDWSAYADGVEDASPTLADASVIPFRPRNGRHPE